jgi:hypothetical protein
MHHQHIARGEVAQQIFCAPPESGHQLAIKPFDEVGLKRKAQITAPRFDPSDAIAFHDRLQAATNSLNFGQFGHWDLENRVIWLALG